MWEKLKLIGLMEKDSVIIKIRKKSSMENSKMGNWKAKVNFILLVEIIILVSSNSIKKMGVGYTNGLEKNPIFIKDNS